MSSQHPGKPVYRLQVGTARHREVKERAQGHTVKQGWSWNLNPGHPAHIYSLTHLEKHTSLHGHTQNHTHAHRSRLPPAWPLLSPCQWPRGTRGAGGESCVRRPWPGRDFPGWFMAKLQIGINKKPVADLPHPHTHKSVCLVWQNPSDLSAPRREGVLGWLVPGLQGLETGPVQVSGVPSPAPPPPGPLSWGQASRLRR